jgi:hypothetical protein
MERCKHTELRWDLDGCNEKGWTCVDTCGKKLGFRPDLDREQLTTKIECILLHLHEQEYFYVSNSTAGEFITRAISERCVSENTYDQQSIVRFILETDEPDHSDFWRGRAHQEMTNVRKVVRRLREREGSPLLFEAEGTPKPEIDLSLLVQEKK